MNSCGLRVVYPGVTEPEYVRTMAEAFADLPARVLWKLTPGEAEALVNITLGSHIKARLGAYFTLVRTPCRVPFKTTMRGIPQCLTKNRLEAVTFD